MIQVKQHPDSSEKNWVWLRKGLIVSIVPRGEPSRVPGADTVLVPKADYDKVYKYKQGRA